MLRERIAIVGMACHLPDARTPAELWESVLAQRRAFRRIPEERLSRCDYVSEDPEATDRTYADEAAVLEGWEFDRAAFRVGVDAFRSTDLAHWLALEVASQALGDAGFPDGAGLPREATAVLIGNTLTGDQSRAGALRLRWPYVRRVVAAALDPQSDEIWASVEAAFKAPFPVTTEDSLAGGLSNTIAGRIANFFDLGGGAFTVDGACASSLLAIAQGCSALAAGDADVVVAGGVDLSLDPFELVGFAKTRALAAGDMRVYDARSSGFIPGEGCALIVLVRERDAEARGLDVRAVVAGWGMSSDGAGGLTRPDLDGQLLALRRTYARAGFGPDSLGLVEGHGTGTPTGDTVELRALTRALREAGASRPVALGSVKANIGHLKAASGAASVVKAVMALDAGVLPPTTGCVEPHEDLRAHDALLRILNTCEEWPPERPLRAGVSAMGFGGINAHVVLEAPRGAARLTTTRPNRKAECFELAASAQDAEAFFLAEPDAARLRALVDSLRPIAARLSRAELADVAAELARRPSFSARAAIVASKPRELEAALELIGRWLAEGRERALDAEHGAFLGIGLADPRIVFLFPGQGAPLRDDAGALGRRFPSLVSKWERGGAQTDSAQPAIVASELAGLTVVERLGLRASAAVGHSLGELVALHWAGAWDESTLARIARVRGRAMGELPAGGAMAAIGAAAADVAALPGADRVALAGLNAPGQTVVSGERSTVEAVVAAARAQGLAATLLDVSHAFHSPLVAASVGPLREALLREELRAVQREVVSTVTGREIAPDDDLRALLLEQVTSPVLFERALRHAAHAADLLVEIGPGSALSQMARTFVEAPALSLDVGGASLRGLLQALAAAFALGARLDGRGLFEGRFTRPIALDRKARFIASPCELAPPRVAPTPVAATPRDIAASSRDASRDATPGRGALEIVRELLAERLELPASAIREDMRLLEDLHLNSLSVARHVTEAARRLRVVPPVAPLTHARATVGQIAESLERLPPDDGTQPNRTAPPGLAAWMRTFEIVEVELPPIPSARPRGAPGSWRVLGEDDDFLRELRRRLSDVGGQGVVVRRSPHADDRCLEMLLRGAREAVRAPAGFRFVLVQHGGGAAAFARCLQIEAPDVEACVIDVPHELAEAPGWVADEVAAAHGWREVRRDVVGRRFGPRLRALDGAPHDGELPIGSSDVILASGGARGIGAECAIELARASGAALALLGRSDRDHPDVAATLSRLRAAGVLHAYEVADVTDRASVSHAVAKLAHQLGPPTAIVHAAGVNEPAGVDGLDEAAMRRALSVKRDGARHLVAAVDASRLKAVVTFGSIIARIGMRGEAAYAHANESLRQWSGDFGSEHPRCRRLHVEWSAFSDVGMAVSLGAIDSLVREGVTLLSPADGARELVRLLRRAGGPEDVVVTGRFGDPVTARALREDLPLLRFLELPRVHVPGVELIADAELSLRSDPYLGDHALDGELLLPAVMGLEAMAQAAAALAGPLPTAAFRDVSFDRPIVVARDGTTTARLVALRAVDGTVEVALRCESTGFAVDHFKATCVLGPAGRLAASTMVGETDRVLPLDPAHDLYGGLLFQGRRFQRLKSYRRLGARECVADVATGDATGWFAPWLPQVLLLGDAGARDAAIHAVQACIPHATVLPTGVERIAFGAAASSHSWTTCARERSRDGDRFTYDVDVVDGHGSCRERWEGLRLRVVGRPAFATFTSPVLFGPFLERRVGEIVPGAALGVAVETGEGPREARSDVAIQRAMGERATILRTRDGRPHALGREAVATCASHAPGLTLAVAGTARVGCDIEIVSDTEPAEWASLLGPQRAALAAVLASATGEDERLAAARVWTAGECLRKAGLPPDAPLVLGSTEPDGLIVVRSGPLSIATVACTMGTAPRRRVVAAVLAEPST